MSYDKQVHVFNLDSLTYSDATPHFASMPSALAFQPGTSTMVVVCSNHQVQWIERRKIIVSLFADDLNVNRGIVLGDFWNTIFATLHRIMCVYNNFASYFWCEVESYEF